MNNDFIFSWAENAEGRMVHVDSVPRGLQCGCTCPNCHEPLLARHGEKNEHGFAHHSDTRGANLNICYMVILYKLAEQIIQTKKRIHAPSYYGIFPEKDIDFADVKVDSCYEREDKQPDVIATTVDGTQYLIEFTFDYKVQHKQAIDYKNLNCLEIDLSKQSLETVEQFLLESNADRKWLNNQSYFENIVPRYQKANRIAYEIATTNADKEKVYSDISFPDVHLGKDERVELFRSLFRGREDVFARRWYSNATNKGGYQPVCINEWRRGICDKKAVKCADCPNRNFLPLGYDEICRHLIGNLWAITQRKTT